MSKSLVCVLLFSSVLIPAAVQAQEPQLAGPAAPRLGYFSARRAYIQSADGKAAQAKLSTLQAETSKQLEAQNAKLQALQNALVQSGALLSDAARRQRELEIERFQVDLQRFVEDAQAEFLAVQRQLESAFLAKLRPALESVAKDRGLLLVLNEDAGVLAWADPRLDITPEVLKRVN